MSYHRIDTLQIDKESWLKFFNKIRFLVLYFEVVLLWVDHSEIRVHNECLYFWIIKFKVYESGKLQPTFMTFESSLNYTLLTTYYQFGANMNEENSVNMTKNREVIWKVRIFQVQWNFQIFPYDTHK